MSGSFLQFRWLHHIQQSKCLLLKAHGNAKVDRPYNLLDSIRSACKVRAFVARSDIFRSVEISGTGIPVLNKNYNSKAELDQLVSMLPPGNVFPDDPSPSYSG
jgi:hypothetical protein